jgi:hypothetical protein
MVCTPELVFSGTEGVGSRFHVLRSLTHFRWYRGRPVSFSCFTLPDSFRRCRVRRVSSHVLRARNHFRLYRGCRVPFSCFALPDMFSTMPSASGLVLKFCAPGLIFGGTESVGSRFHVLCSPTCFLRCHVRRVAFSCFARPDSFSAVPTASGPVFMFCVIGLVLAIPRASGPIFIICAFGLIFDGTECVVCYFYVFRSRTCFWRYRGRRVPFSCFVRPDSFSAVPNASGPVFMFCAPALVFGGAKFVGSRFHVLRAQNQFRRYEGVRTRFHVFFSRTHFRRCRGCRVSFSCFACPDSFLTVPRASGAVFMFCALILIFVGTEGGESSFHDLRARTHFRLYRGRRVQFSCFVIPDSFSAVSSSLGPVLMFCICGINYDGIDGVGTRFLVFYSRTHFRRCRGCRVPFSCFVCPDSFSTVPRASGAVFMFCAPGLIFVSAEVVGSNFHVLRAQTHFRLYRGRRVQFSLGPVFMFCAPGLIFVDTEGGESSFHDLRPRNQFRRYRGRRDPFSCFLLPNSFSSVPRVSGPVFMFCVPGLIFDGTEGVGCRFHVLRSRTRFRRYRGNRDPFSCFALPNSFLAVPSASGLVFIFCAPKTIFDGIEGDESRFHVLRALTRFGDTECVVSRFHVLRTPTRFRQYRGRQIPYSNFARPESFSAVPRASGLVFMFCTPGLIFGGAEGVGSRIHVLRA